MAGKVVRFIVICGVVFIVATGVGIFAADRRTEQPYAFNHAAHAAKSDCTLCHRGARSEARAGLPSFKACTPCHATAPGKGGDSAREERWKSLYASNPPWNRRYQLPDHVYFSHQRHVTLGGNACERCHGDIGTSTSPPAFAAVPIAMRSCITCHEREQVTVDCTACHR